MIIDYLKEYKKVIAFEIIFINDRNTKSQTYDI